MPSSLTLPWAEIYFGPYVLSALPPLDLPTHHPLVLAVREVCLRNGLFCLLCELSGAEREEPSWVYMAESDVVRVARELCEIVVACRPLALSPPLTLLP